MYKFNVYMILYKAALSVLDLDHLIVVVIFDLFKGPKCVHVF